MWAAAAVLHILAFQHNDGRCVRLYESMRRMSPYPLELPYVPSSFVRAQPLGPDDVLEKPRPAVADAVRKYHRATLPRRATAADGSHRAVHILEITGTGESYVPRTSRGVDVTRVHLTPAGQLAHSNELRGGRAGELAGDIVQDVSSDDVLLPFADGTFDAVALSLCAPAVSRPFELWAEINRVLVQDGLALVTQCGPYERARVGAMWADMPPETQLYVLASYFFYTDVPTDGWYDQPEARELSVGRDGQPLLAMSCRRLGGAALMWRRLENDRALRREEEADWAANRPRGVTREPTPFTAKGGASDRWRSGTEAVHTPGAELNAPPARSSARQPAAGADGDRLTVIGSPEARAHAECVRAAAAEAAGVANPASTPSAEQPTDGGSARQKILSVVQAGVERAVRERAQRGESLTVAEQEVLDKMHAELAAECRDDAEEETSPRARGLAADNRGSGGGGDDDCDATSVAASM